MGRKPRKRTFERLLNAAREASDLETKASLLVEATKMKLEEDPDWFLPIRSDLERICSRLKDLLAENKRRKQNHAPPAQT